MEKIVRIVVEGGVVQNVEVPEGVVVVVNDYDVEGCEPLFLQTDGNGDQFIESIYEPEDNHANV